LRRVNSSASPCTSSKELSRKKYSYIKICFSRLLHLPFSPIWLIHMYCWGGRGVKPGIPEPESLRTYSYVFDPYHKVGKDLKCRLLCLAKMCLYLEFNMESCRSLKSYVKYSTYTSSPNIELIINLQLYFTYELPPYLLAYTCGGSFRRTL